MEANSPPLYLCHTYYYLFLSALADRSFRSMIIQKFFKSQLFNLFFAT